MSEPTTARDLPPLPSEERLVELMMDAARTGRSDMVAAFLQAGVNIDVQDAKGHTPLVLASYHGWEDTTDLLIRMGARVDLADHARGNTALMGVCFKGNRTVAQSLIQAGAAANLRNLAGQTALMMAALFGHTALVEMLLSAGADPSATDDAGNNAASLAAAQGNVELSAYLDRLSTMNDLSSP